MKAVKNTAGLLGLLTLTLFFALSFGTAALAASDAGHGTDTHAAADAHGADAHGDDAHGASHGSSLSAEKLKDLGWRIVNFIALMIILVKFGAKPIGNSLSNRRKAIKDEIDDLEAKRDSAEASYKEFQEKLAGAEGEIAKVVERAVAQAEVEKTKILEKAEQAAADLKRSAEQAVQNEITVARKMLKNEVADQAAIIAEELIVKNLTDDDQVKIVENYLDKVGAVQ
jgi:F-type H+-transporting ATPase subunit b